MASVKIKGEECGSLEFMKWEIKIFSEPVDLVTVTQMANDTFGYFVKGVVDIEKKILGLGGELHSDIEELLLGHGSIQQNLWGINLHPNEEWPEMVEFDSLINIRPRQNNRSRYVEDEGTRDEIIRLLDEMVRR